MSDISLTYWKFKGRNYYVQAVAQAAGIPVNHIHEFNFQQLKETTLPFGQLPYMEDGSVKMAQSFGILRYIAKKYNLQGDTDAQYAMSEQLIEESVDLRDSGRDARSSDPVTQNRNYDVLFAPDGYIARQFAYLEHMLSDDAIPSFYKDTSKLFVGDYTLVATMDVLQMIEPSIFGAFPKLDRYYRHVIALPAFDGIRDFPLPAAALRQKV